MWLVMRTSKQLHSDLPILWGALDRGEKVLGTVWHQDGFLGPLLGEGREVVVMVSRSDYGNVMAEVLRRLSYIPVRGGSGNRGMEALSEIIEYINTGKSVICGIAADGSRGPAQKAQIGTVLMAKATGVPIYPVRLWAKRKLVAPSWDRMTIPLPFNQLVFLVGDLIHVPPDADREALESYRAKLEDQLNKLVERSKNCFLRGTK
jgi:lysophospholipid acyltransferase (LPLAT)-like uncharacterized protein